MEVSGGAGGAGGSAVAAGKRGELAAHVSGNPPKHLGPPPAHLPRPPSAGGRGDAAGVRGLDLTRFWERALCPHPAEPGVKLPGRRQRCAAPGRERRPGGLGCREDAVI